MTYYGPSDWKVVIVTCSHSGKSWHDCLEGVMVQAKSPTCTRPVLTHNQERRSESNPAAQC